MSIRALDPKVVAQIAAGEVVDRPASVVKELVENSLDAGSSQISVEVRGGGVGLIRVNDNGTGIPYGEVGLAFDRYATSKVANLEDLESIRSLGFRGEALPSIAAVAQVDMVSCATGEKAGVYLNLQDGIISGQGKRGRSQGTTVTAHNLFRKIPARLKFLKSVATENSHIANVVSQYALAFPEVKFSLSIDGRVALRTPGSGHLVDSIAEVYGAEVAGNMIELNTETKTASPRVAGMVGSPRVSRSGRGYLSFFVNRRWVNSRMLARAVEEAYHGLLMVGKHPVAVINISLPHQEVDVNIHPTKSEVKFRNDSAIFSAVQRSVRRALTEQITVPRVELEAIQPIFPSEVRETTLLPYAGASSGSITSAPTPAMSLPVLRVLGQLNNSYIIAEGPDGLYLIDQHAAHERILFEKIGRHRSQRDIEVQGLLEPMTFEVSPRQEAILKTRYQELAEFGFAIEPFGDRTFLIRALPALVHDKDWAGMLRELLDSLSGGNKGDWVEGVTITMACHGAVRAGQSLADAEMRELVRQLEQCATPHTCPHGRPTMIHLSSNQLKKEFGRT
ncbi:MAG: DNA mismatch repair endonuclease MutL [Deltaproteobacteria bacterium]|nr:DNA mismatch repair endonuclease MutL [Deltaproteobacteria bacterium]